MKLTGKPTSLTVFGAFILSGITLTASADVITDWNLITVNATKVAPALNSNLASRIDAIEAIAVYDAVNSIRQFGKPYLYFVPNTGSAQAAAAQAAHDVLVNYFPSQQAALDADLANSLAGITDGPIGNGHYCRARQRRFHPQCFLPRSSHHCAGRLPAYAEHSHGDRAPVRI